MITQKSKKIINTALKILLALTSITFITYKITLISADEGGVVSAISNWWKNSAGKMVFMPFLIFLILSPINWWVETRKWILLMRNLQPVSQNLAWKSILSGEAAGVLTAFGLGTYIGRVIHLKFRNRVVAAVLLLIANITQFIVAYFGFVVATFLFIASSKKLPNYYMFVSLSALLLLIGGIYFFVKIDKYGHCLENARITQKWKKIISVIRDQSGEAIILKLLSLSGTRYLIILTQYLCLFYFFGFTEQLSLILVVLPILFLMVKLLPTLSLFELGATKASIFILLMEFVTGNPLKEGAIVISMISLLIWLFNLAIPALTGSIFLFQAKLIKT